MNNKFRFVFSQKLRLLKLLGEVWEKRKRLVSETILFPVCKTETNQDINYQILSLLATELVVKLS